MSLRNCDYCQQPKISVQVYANDKACCDECLSKIQSRAFDKALADEQQLNQLLEHEMRMEALSANAEFDQYDSPK